MVWKIVLMDLMREQLVSISLLQLVIKNILKSRASSIFPFRASRIFSDAKTKITFKFCHWTLTGTAKPFFFGRKGLYDRDFFFFTLALHSPMTNLNRYFCVRKYSWIPESKKLELVGYKEWTGKTIYLNSSSIFGDFF